MLIMMIEGMMRMRLSAEEKLMFEVMRAIYDSGIPISFKGSMVLKACLAEAGYSEEIRHTADIDANWNYETDPAADHMTESLQLAMSNKGLGLDVHLFRMYGVGRSAGIELSNHSSGEILFTIDIDVNRPVPDTKLYEVEGIRFVGASPVQMIADKVATISTDKVFRRIKDVIDLSYFSKVFLFDRDLVMETLRKSGKTLGDFKGFLHRTDELKHAYEKFRFGGDANKPSFEETYNAVLGFIKSVLPGA